MKTIGIVAHSAEGGSLCFLTACREGARHLGPHMHPPIVVSAIPMGLSMPGWEADDHAAVGANLVAGVRQVADAGADFFICPDNTAHIALEKVATQLPLPGLHIAEVVGEEIAAHGWKRVGLLGTKWTMNGPVYERALEERGLERLIPDESTQELIQAAIFDELCQGVFPAATTQMFVDAIAALRAQGADCVVLGCTEIPLIISEANSPLPILDSTRLLAKQAVRRAIDERPLTAVAGWLAEATVVSGHIVLLGDSIFDNKAYTQGEPDVVARLRAALPGGWRATLVAVDGDTTAQLQSRLAGLPGDASHMVVSIGGNDVLGHFDLLDQRIASTREALLLFGRRAGEFERDYRSAIQGVLDVGLPTTLCTIYNGNLAEDEAPPARVALTVFNDAILRVAFEQALPLIELRLVCTEPADYANPIEPSGRGGWKIANAIVTAHGLSTEGAVPSRVYRGPAT